VTDVVETDEDDKSVIFLVPSTVVLEDIDVAVVEVELVTDTTN
jgi:hypothetical protein